MPVTFERDLLDVVAVHDGDRISHAVTNMGGRQIAVDLSDVAKRVNAVLATQTRLNDHQGEVVVEPEHAVEAAAVPVDVNETTIIRLYPKTSLEPAGTLQLDRKYALDTPVRSDGTPMTLEIAVDNFDAIRSARLMIGLHRRGGITDPPAVTLNGEIALVNPKLLLTDWLWKKEVRWLGRFWHSRVA